MQYEVASKLASEQESNLDVKGESMDPTQSEKLMLSELQVREAISTFLWLGFLAGLTIAVKVPLDRSPAAAAVGKSKAPWVFGSIQWLLQRWPVWLSGSVLPALSALVLLSLPWWSQKVGKMWTWIIFLILSSIWVGLTLMYRFMG